MAHDAERLQGITEWITDQVGPPDAIERVHERPWASVYRVATSQGHLWLKACSESQAFEPGLTARLASRTPALLPELIAHNDSLGWLLLADAGGEIGFDGPRSIWGALLPQYAALQQLEAAHTDEHLSAGVPDRRLDRFPVLYDELLSRDLPLGRATVKRLRAFRERFAAMCDELWAYGLPATPQHDDLHGGNVHKRGDSVRILDWGDACISHPYLTMYVTFVHLDDVTADESLREGLRDSYLEPWGSTADQRRAFEIAYRLGPFAHLFKELRVLDALPPPERGALGPDLSSLLGDCVAEIERSDRASDG